MSELLKISNKTGITVVKPIYNLKELRTKSGISSNDLALKLNITRQYLSRIENKHVVPRVDLAIKLANEFNVLVESIIWEKDNECNQTQN